MVVSVSRDRPWPEVPSGNKDFTQAAVVIIGAGISGMCMAIDLIKRNKCHNFVIVEKSSGVGGTWHDNKYPGCCCDVWSMLYSYSFEQNPDWTREYPGQEEILAYLQAVAEKYGLYKYIRFNTAVEEARWDDAEQKWKVDVKVIGAKDSEFSPAYTITSDYLVSAVGQLNSPKYPQIPGLDTFKGKMMHSARWDWSYGLEGKKIAVIGNGATAAQIIPEVVKVASRTTVYQRSPNWVIPELMPPTPPSSAPSSNTCLQSAGAFARCRWTSARVFDAVTDKDSKFAQDIRDWCIGQMHAALPDQPELWAKLTPNYSPGCKRVIISDDYYPALALPNVRLETRAISQITESGIEVEGGDTEDYDLIVLATGFRTVEFMHPINVIGANGRSIKDIWKGGARALYGTTVEDLPNFGMFYGPNTNLGHNSIILMIEAQSRYLNAMVKAKLALKPRPERVKEYNDEVQEILNKSSFADPSCNSWYKNEEGRITNNWSGTVIEYQDMLSKVNWDDYIAEGSGAEMVKGKGETKLGRVQEETSVSNLTLALGALSALAVGVGYFARGSRLLRAR
ncbi:hypothetical protein H2199_006501 [Coniosporium tulheliwenetii]|uniref:Uncharacterized protein n=1 Tax=Coniosporium tulheliwenetii TaxID=3383036 RepID=A0ACC2YVW1_9PEZI|nr:hypothetical protein H2199_006501 [Cladosporium sp. JES 115]